MESNYKAHDFSPPHPGVTPPGIQHRENVPKPVVCGLFSKRCWDLFGMALAALFTFTVVITVVVMAFAKDDAYKPEFSQFVGVKDGKVQTIPSGTLSSCCDCR